MSVANDSASANSSAARETYEPLASFQDSLSDGTHGPEMVVIPAGEYLMGSEEFFETKPIHKVWIRKPFALGKTPITQAQWRQIMGSDPMALRLKDCDACPVTNVSWDDAQAFVEKLNALSGKAYRLPTESEWEYAARAGCNYVYAGGDDIDAVAWINRNSGKKIHPVGSKGANAWGLYDMSGNVHEWVQDNWCSDYLGKPGTEEAVTLRGDSGKRTMRGGSAQGAAGQASCTERVWGQRAFRDDFIGFRLARSLS